MDAGFHPIPPRPAPRRTKGAVAWLRSNLFASIPNAIATLLLGAAVAWLAFHFIRWGVVNAVGKPDADLCQAARGVGACWGVIVEKGRFILMGRYPSAEHWRAVLAMLALLTPVIGSCSPRCWKPWLALLWVAGIGMFFLLMLGGVLGLPRV
ncbi:MAG: amino acid ABC transporter permease, partial [Ramlibacter sp.]